MTLTPEHETAIRERLAAVIPGRWEYNEACEVEAPGYTVASYVPDPADGQLIAHAPDDLATLLAELDRVRADRDELAGQAHELHRRLDAERMRLGQSIHRHADQLLRQARDERDALAAENERLRKENKQLHWQYDGNADEANRLRAQLARCDARYDDGYARGHLHGVQSCDREIDRLHTLVAEGIRLREELDRLRAKYEDVANENSDLRFQLDTAHYQRIFVEKRAYALQKRCEEMHSTRSIVCALPSGCEHHVSDHDVDGCLVDGFACEEI